MRACSACSGFVPDHLAACPHCAAAPSRWSRVGRVLAGLVGAAGTVMTLAACYGAPPYVDTCIDQDGDGWFPGCYDEEGTCDPEDANCDCDDLDPSTNPGELDGTGDDTDRDCDGKDGQRPGGPLGPGGPDAWSWADAALDIDAEPPDASVP